MAKVRELELYDRFSCLKGADLLYACIARVEDNLLVTHDSDFDPYSDELDSATFVAERLRGDALWGLVVTSVDLVAQEFREDGMQG